MARPNPDGWRGGSEDFEFLRTYDGHIAQSDKGADDLDARRNARRNFADADLGSESYRTDK